MFYYFEKILFMEKIIQLSDDFNLHPLKPENADYFRKNTQIEDIFSSWKTSWQCSIKDVQDHTAYYIDHLCNPKTQESTWEKHKIPYGVKSVDDYGVVRRGVWVGKLTHRHFHSKEGERQLGNYGIQLFDLFQGQWLGTLLTAQWIGYLQKTAGIPGISASCDIDNIPSMRMLQKSRHLYTRIWLPG